MASGNTLAKFLALGYEPPATDYATLALRNQHPVLAFIDDAVIQKTAVWSDVMPQHYGGGNIVARVTWAAVPTSGTAGWDVTLERVADAGQDIDSDGWATAQTVTAATVPGTSGQTKTTSVTITAGATGTDSIAAGDPYRIRLRRDVANDTAAGDVQALHVELREA